MFIAFLHLRGKGCSICLRDCTLFCTSFSQFTLQFSITMHDSPHVVITPIPGYNYTIVANINFAIYIYTCTFEVYLHHTCVYICTCMNQCTYIIITHTHSHIQVRVCVWVTGFRKIKEVELLKKLYHPNILQ